MSYASDSAADRLAAVRQAIDNCLTAQRYRRGNREKYSAELSSLMALERELMQEIAAGSTGGSMCSLAEMEAPR